MYIYIYMRERFELVETYWLFSLLVDGHVGAQDTDDLKASLLWGREGKTHNAVIIIQLLLLLCTYM